MSGAQQPGRGSSAKGGAGLRRSRQQEDPRESGPSEARRWGRGCGKLAGPLPKWWDTLDPTGCRAEARGVRWGRQRNGSAGRGSETGNRGPRAESKGNAAGSRRQAQEAREQRYRRGQTGEFLGEAGPLPSPHPHGWGGPRAAYPADYKEVGHHGWRQTLRPAPRSRRLSQAPGKGRNVGAEPGGSTWSGVGSLVPKPLSVTANPAPQS